MSNWSPGVNVKAEVTSATHGCNGNAWMENHNTSKYIMTPADNHYYYFKYETIHHFQLAR